MSTGDKILYREMSRTELDRQYNARATVDDIEPILARYAELSAEARRDLEVMCDIPYGSHGDETFDFFPAGKGAPIFVFIHGGYWRLLSKNESSFFAKHFVGNGISVAAVNYSLAPKAHLDEIVAQVRAAVAHIWLQAGSYNIDRDRIFVGGSSAGGHLAAMLLCDDWQPVAGLPLDVVAGAILASGLFDLEPVRMCHPNDWIRLDRSSAKRNSPIHHLPQQGCPVLVRWGGSETREFKRQSRDFASAWSRNGFPVTSLEIPDRNHFDIILDLADPCRNFAQHAVSMIQATRYISR